MEFKKLGLIAALTALGIAAPSPAKINVVSAGSVQTGNLSLNSFQSVVTPSGEIKVLTVTDPKTLTLWNVTQGRKLASYPISINTPGDFVHIHDLRQLSNGDLVAVVGNHNNSTWAGQVYVYNLTRNQIVHALDTDASIEVVPFTRKDGSVVYSLSGDGTGRNGVFTLVDPQSLSIIRAQSLPFTGSVHVFEKADGSLGAIIGGYQVVALWDPQAGTTQTLISNNTQGPWPTVVAAPNGDTLLKVSEDSKVSLYSLADLERGKLTVARALGANESIADVDGQPLVVERIASKQGQNTETEIRLHAWNDDSQILGDVTLPASIQNSAYARLPNGDVVGLLGGPLRTFTFVSPAKVFYVNFTSGQVLYELDTPRSNNRIQLGLDRTGSALAEVFADFDNLRFIDLPSGKVLSQSSTQAALAPFFRLADGRLGSLVSDKQTGKTSVIDWTDNGASVDFPAGAFNPQLAPYGYYQLDLQALRAGAPFLVPTYTNTSNQGILQGVLVGFRAFRLE